MPTCTGAARRVVLNHLGNRYGRRFANHWAFVRFAREPNLDLDFTTPHRRPEHERGTVRFRLIELIGISFPCFSVRSVVNRIHEFSNADRTEDHGN